MDDIIDHMDQDDLLPPTTTTTTTPSLNTSTTTTTVSTRKRRIRDNDDSDSDMNPNSNTQTSHHTEPPNQKRPRLPSPFTLQAERLEEALNREIQAQEDEITMHRYRMMNRRALNEAHDRMFRLAMFPDQASEEEYNLQLRRCYELKRREEMGDGDGDMDVDGDGEMEYGYEGGEGEDMAVSSAGATVNSSPVHRAQHVPVQVQVQGQGQAQDNVSPVGKKGCLTGVRGGAGMAIGGEFAIYEDHEPENSARAYDLAVNYHEVRSYRDWDEDKENVEEEDEHANGTEAETEGFLQVDADQDMERDDHEGGADGDEEELDYADTELDPADEALGDQLRRRRYYSLRRQRRQLASHGRSATEASQDVGVGVGRGRRGMRRL
ncbi:hypothetical protein BO78DRAFT_421927 [Aspergillus sclerotiicarbonarius CBS 121057]|uniref:Uncharacterized protein n=1 Tax=Aspergillus sclerotiicarbonarius (strain CBS 121057 / IBT 28362) TaxID=1448318 RepID=A0A319DZ10_ASPSB|nr:hypothetical protein BO78DRAFT_421927 [Aspergillus sclerotiicarbonarius CBS 121057]